MIDTIARQQLAKLIHKLATKHLTNTEFEDALPPFKEKALKEIFYRGIWPFYDDLRDHKLAGKYTLTPENKEYIARIILFLHTDAPYKWPIIRKRLDVSFIFMTILLLFGLAMRLEYWLILAFMLTFIWVNSKKIWWKHLAKKGGGDLAVWPFFNQVEYQYALANPTVFSDKDKI